MLSFVGRLQDESLMWTYDQKSGQLSRDGANIIRGYSGAGEGKNRPEDQEIHNVGPIPRGKYTINAPQDTVTHGPYVLPLTPSPENEMFGRDGFLIHGDSKVDPGTASEGCVILPRNIRERIWASGDTEFTVV